MTNFLTQQQLDDLESKLKRMQSMLSISKGNKQIKKNVKVLKAYIEEQKEMLKNVS